jgi:hypothetical protein
VAAVRSRVARRAASAVGKANIHRLAVAIRSAVGIESLVWLTDIAGLSREEAARQLRWTAQALLAHALAEGLP